MKSLQTNRESHPRGRGLIIWSSIFILLSVVMPGIATIISLLLALGLHKYPERRKIEIILTLISIIVTVVLWVTGFLAWYWPDFMAGIRSAL